MSATLSATTSATTMPSWTLYDGSETLTEWNSESFTNLLTNLLTYFLRDIQGSLLLAIDLVELQNTCKKCLKDPTYAIFLISWGFKDAKYNIPMCQFHSTHLFLRHQTALDSKCKISFSQFQPLTLQKWPNMANKMAKKLLWHKQSRPKIEK